MARLIPYQLGDQVTLCGMTRDPAEARWIFDGPAEGGRS